MSLGLQKHPGQQPLVPQSNRRSPVLRADDLHAFWSTSVPFLAEWELCHTVAITLTYLDSGNSVIWSSFSVFVPRNNPESHHTKLQGSKISDILNKNQIFSFWTGFCYSSAWYNMVFTSLAFNIRSAFQLCFSSYSSCRGRVWEYVREGEIDSVL